MATVETTPTEPQAETETTGQRWRFNVDDYYKLAEVGILGPESQVELIEGDVIAMSPIGSRHCSVVIRLNRALVGGLGDRAVLSPQNPVRLSRYSELQPDIALLRPREDFYASAHPGPADTLLAIEVMDSSARYDRGRKLPLYARSGIAEVWLVDLNAQTVETYRRPVEGKYQNTQIFGRGQTVTPEAFPDLVLGIDTILG